MIPEYRWGWAYISHFIHSRFYCYSYVFGELVSLALFEKYEEEGPSFLVPSDPPVGKGRVRQPGQSSEGIGGGYSAKLIFGKRDSR